MTKTYNSPEKMQNPQKGLSFDIQNLESDIDAQYLEETRADIETSLLKKRLETLQMTTEIQEDLLSGLDLDDPAVRAFLIKEVGISFDK